MSVFGNDEDIEDVKEIARQRPNNGKTSYAGPFLLHQSSKKRKLVVSNFVPRTAGEQVCVKLFEETPHPGDNCWEYGGIETNSISLNATAMS